MLPSLPHIFPGDQDQDRDQDHLEEERRRGGHSFICISTCKLHLQMQMHMAEGHTPQPHVLKSSTIRSFHTTQGILGKCRLVLGRVKLAWFTDDDSHTAAARGAREMRPAPTRLGLPT